MPRISLGMAIFLGGVISVEAFLGGMFVQRNVFSTANPERTLSPHPDDREALTNAEDRIANLEHEVGALRSQLQLDLVRDLDVTVTESQTAYLLVEPTLMISVDALHGGPVLAHFGTQTHFFMVGQRVDFRVRDCFCYLLLRESVRDRAVFHFGCERDNPDETPLQSAPGKAAPEAVRDLHTQPATLDFTRLSPVVPRPNRVISAS